MLSALSSRTPSALPDFQKKQWVGEGSLTLSEPSENSKYPTREKKGNPVTQITLEELYWGLLIALFWARLACYYPSV